MNIQILKSASLNFTTLQTEAETLLSTGLFGLLSLSNFAALGGARN
jgi:hypothetical protein